MIHKFNQLEGSLAIMSLRGRGRAGFEDAQCVRESPSTKMASLTTTTINQRETEYLETCSAFSDVFVREQRADGCATVINYVRKRLTPDSSNDDASLTQQAKWATWRLATSSPFDNVRRAFQEFAGTSVDDRSRLCSTYFVSPQDPLATAKKIILR